MRKWLEEKYPKLLKRRYRSVKLCVYLSRIQKRIEREMDMLLWLALNRPDILLNKRVTLNQYGHVHHFKDQSHERLKTLLLAVKALSKNAEVELVKNEPE